MIVDETLYNYITACPLCGAERCEVIRSEKSTFNSHNEEEKKFFSMYEKDPIYLRQCQSCDFIYTDKLPKDSIFFEKLYSRIKCDYDYEFNYHGKKDIYQDIKQQLQEYCQQGSLLDIGTWCGTLLASMSETYSAVGCEISKEAADYGRSKGLDIRIGSFDQVQFSPESFDIITIIDVLEHLPKPKDVISKILGLLKPGGIVYIKVPNGSAQINKQNLLQSLKLSSVGVANCYVHINHFGHKSLKNVLESVGFEVVELGYTKAEIWDLSHPYTMNVKIKKWIDNQIRKLTTQSASLMSYIVPFDLGLNIYVVAKKPIRMENM